MHNTSILKFDYTPGSKHRIFVRGNLQKDVISSSQQFPGLPASTATEDNTKGLAAGDTWTISSRLVNDIRYGYTRQGFGSSGVGVGNYTVVRFIAAPTAETRSNIRIVPINTITDNLNYTKGSHSIQVGGTWRLVHNNSFTNANSFNVGARIRRVWRRRRAVLMCCLILPLWLGRTTIRWPVISSAAT